MKNLSSALLAAINSGQICTILSIVAQDGTAGYYTDHETNLVLPGIAATLGTLVGGSGYVSGAYAVQLSGGTGSGCICTLTIVAGVVTAAVILQGGSGYTAGDTLSFTPSLGGSGFSIVVATVTSNTYVPAPGLQRFSLKLNSTAQVSNQNVAASVLDLPAAQLLSGKWDSARITLSVCGWAMTNVQSMVVFSGAIGVIGWTDEAFQVDLQNFVRNLGRNVGKLVTPTCRHRLYDLGVGFDEIGHCGINPAGFTQAVAVSAILTGNLKFKVSLSGQATGWATTGYVQWTSGNNSGQTSIVKVHTLSATSAIGESVELLIPTTAPIQVGDTLNLLAGCDHTVGTCFSKFGNQLNFGGFPGLQVDQNATVSLP